MPAVVFVHGGHIQQIAPPVIIDLRKAAAPVKPDALGILVFLFQRQAQMLSFVSDAPKAFHSRSIGAEYRHWVSFPEGRKHGKLPGKLHREFRKRRFCFIARRRQKRFLRRCRAYAFIKACGKGLKVFRGKCHPRSIGMSAKAGKIPFVRFERRMQVHTLDGARGTRQHPIPLGKEHNRAIIPLRQFGGRNADHAGVPIRMF